MSKGLTLTRSHWRAWDILPTATSVVSALPNCSVEAFKLLPSWQHGCSDFGTWSGGRLLLARLLGTRHRPSTIAVACLQQGCAASQRLPAWHYHVGHDYRPLSATSSPFQSAQPAQPSSTVHSSP